MTSQRTQASFLTGLNAAFLTHLFIRYLKDPLSINPSWTKVFQNYDDDLVSLLDELKGASWERQISLESIKVFNEFEPEIPSSSSFSSDHPLDKHPQKRTALDSIRASRLIHAHRLRGHLRANLDPLGLENGGFHSELEPETYGFTNNDYNRLIFIDGYLGKQSATLKEIYHTLERTYGGTIGIEFMHIEDPEQKAWLQERFETPRQRYDFTKQEKKEILCSLIQADTFEHFLSLKYPGTKRFAVEGGEAVLVALHQMLTRAGQKGVEEVILGMAHRGRLNVMANVLNKPYREIFFEFQGGINKAEISGSGDVKYHLGYSANCLYGGQKMRLSLTPNPSHLESVNPVVLGKVRSNQELAKDEGRTRIMGLLLHGDASIAAQGLVAETLSLSEAPAYNVGGTIHIIINNQIGFTTSPKYLRTSPYPSEVVKIIQAPIFHVNGDDPETVAYVSRLAIDFRQRFKKDIVIDIVCYRRNGHNELDEPAFTQPLMYKAIAKKPSVLKIYTEKLVTEESIIPQETPKLIQGYKALLESEFENIENFTPQKVERVNKGRPAYKFDEEERQEEVNTAVEIEVLDKISEVLVKVPEHFSIHPRLERLLEEKKKKLQSHENIDWASAEALAFGSLLYEGYPVRLSGQDSRRGTFSQRHAVFVDQQTESTYIPLNHITKHQAQIEVINTPLSETAVVAFEYGFSLASSQTLVLWEAQFGDFANGAQVIIDQFLCAGETKWLSMSGLVLLLPHGYEGQGPEHSSARLERYLQLCAENNWQVVNCSTPSNYFHVLRRQLLQNFHKPLILMTPKSLLRHKHAVSTFKDMGPGSAFLPVLSESDAKIRVSRTIKRVILCSGKVYYDLFLERQKQQINDIAIIRLEQFYPFPKDHLAVELSAYKEAEIIWCQEEPENMGAWKFVDRLIENVLLEIGHLKSRPVFTGRKASAATATGYLQRHEAEQKHLIDQALLIV